MTSMGVEDLFNSFYVLSNSRSEVLNYALGIDGPFLLSTVIKDCLSSISKDKSIDISITH